MQSVQNFSFVVYISNVRIECQIKNVLKPKEHFWIVLIKISFRNEELNHICRKIKLTLCDRIMPLTDTFLVLWVLYAWSPDRKWFPKLYRKWFSDGKEGNIWTQEFGQWTWNLYNLIFLLLRNSENREHFDTILKGLSCAEPITIKFRTSENT